MKYIYAFKGGIIVFFLFVIVAVIMPEIEIDSGLEAAFGASTFVFSILAGFFIGRGGARYTAVSDATSDEDTWWFNIFETSKVLGEDINQKFIEIIDEYYRRAYDFNIGTYYKHTVQQMHEAYNVVEEISDRDFNKVELHAINNIFRGLSQVERARNISARSEEERMTLGMWSVLLSLGLIVIVSIFLLSDNSIMFDIAAVLFSTAVIVIILLIRDLFNFKLGGAMLAEESGQEIFEALGKPRYYHKDALDTGLIMIPEHVKEYRLASHKPGEKEMVSIVKNI